MIDSKIQFLIQPVLRVVVYPLRGRVTPDQLTLIGFAIGLIAVVCVVLQLYWYALVAIIINRIFDGLDGALARATCASDFGGFLDIVCDFIFYAAVAASFGIAQPQYSWVSLLLVVSFVATGSSFLAYASLAKKPNLSNARQQKKALHYIGGITEGTETIIFFILICVFPQWFWLLGLIFAMLCFITAISRCIQAKEDLSIATWNSDV